MRRFKNIFEYAFLFGLNGLMLWYFRGYLNLLIAVAMIVFLVLDVTSVLVLKRYLSISIEVPGEQMPKNTTFVVRVNVRNQSVIPLINGVIRLQIGNVFMGETAGQDIEIPLKPLAVTGLGLPLCSACVGDVEIRTEKIVLTDFLGMFCTEREASAADHVFIIPRGETEQEFSLNAFEKGMNEVEETQMRGSDFSDVSQIREYIPGDAIINIHWKLSAKKRCVDGKRAVTDVVTEASRRAETGKVVRGGSRPYDRNAVFIRGIFAHEPRTVHAVLVE